MGTVDIDAIVVRLHKLEEENARLKTLLSKHGIPYEERKQARAYSCSIQI